MHGQRGDSADIIPVAVVRDLEAVLLGKQGQFGIAGFFDNLRVLLVP